ncbi:MAG: 30S ribosome-binding factor RbfA [Candidatus Omnitrophica bacterium]|nr:30S ribosome-binding factor RbfA [Candidatus Omnitrophota bacterium]MCM8798600.1 30S ribosome-binding factor RbfA [Candidatus Omnitrophota bacterium]
MKQRAQKVAQAFKKEVSQIVHNELRDPGLGFITITHVEMTDDLRFARIYYSILGSEKDKEETAQALRRGERFIRKLLAQRIRLRFVPEIRFIPDSSGEYSIHIQEILDKIEGERESAQPDK